ncbi:MAG TPA: glycosyltransferase family 2 protein, partial [Burkholderiales bacterium]|nr:glycosyltransferase family 2 protein [Burkholderiales bacterium]
AAVRRLVEKIDWPCRVDTLFREANLGCKKAVSEAITWFFDQVQAGVILEDDCVPHPSFFPFAAELLDRYRDDERICMISGDNFLFGQRRTPYSYYFSRYTHIWGWASWRRAWALYDHGMTLWPELREGGWLMDILGEAAAARYWSAIFDATHADLNSSWAYRWTFAAWASSSLTVIPAVNLVSNIGFGEAATHTVNRSNRFAALPVSEMVFPLSHPPYVIRNDRADRFTQKRMFTTAWWRRAAGRILRGATSLRDAR